MTHFSEQIKQDSFLDLYAGVKTDFHIYTIHHKFF